MTNLNELFLLVLTTAWRACPVLLAVFLARLVLSGAPAGCRRPLWWGAFFRLACPFALILPIPVQNAARTRPLPMTIAGAGADAGFDRPITEAVTPKAVPVGTPQPPSLQNVLSVVWLIGLALMLVWGVLSFLRFSRCLVGAVRLRDNIWLGDELPAPVTVGVLRPRIYLPSSLEGKERGYVILHERNHIRWGDPLFKALAFLILAAHWFNPLAWAAFLLACRDLETACDQGVLNKTGENGRQEYAAALLHLSTGRKILAGGPPAFGEGDTKGRIRRVMNYRKLPIWVKAIAGTAAAAVFAVALLGPVPELYAAEKPGAEPEGFIPYDSFHFALMPGEAEVSRQTIAIPETADLHYQVNWQPMGLNIEVALEQESGQRVGTAPVRLAEGRGGEAGGVFEDLPPGEYCLIIRNAAENQQYANTTAREDLEITGAAAFGWQENGSWRIALTASPREGSITFPAYTEGREDYNAAVYDIRPFQLGIRLPEGWSVRVPPAEARGTSFAFTPLWLYQGEEYAGSIGYNTFEVYPDVPPENFYRMVYNQLMLGSVVNWDNDYTVVRDWGSGCSATVQIMERQNTGVANAANPAEMRPGILAYDKDLLVYVAIELENGRLSNYEVWELAESLELFRLPESSAD